MTKKKLVEFLKEKFENEPGIIDLKNLDFGELVIDLDGLKARRISNQGQKANVIFNNKQETRDGVFNDKQKCLTGNIYNGKQTAEGICNEDQKAGEWINNSDQEAKTIRNLEQEALKVYN